MNIHIEGLDVLSEMVLHEMLPDGSLWLGTPWVVSVSYHPDPLRHTHRQVTGELRDISALGQLLIWPEGGAHPTSVPLTQIATLKLA